MFFLVVATVMLCGVVTGERVERYVLMSQGEEEISNVNLYYMKLLEWANRTEGVTMVEPFVCDSYIGGLPGWTMEPSGLFVRNPACPLKPHSWYFNMSASERVRSMKQPIPYDQFVEMSHTCEDYKSPPQPPYVYHTAGYGNCVQICLVAHIDWSLPPKEKAECRKERLTGHNIKQENGIFKVLLPWDNMESSLTIANYECFHPDYIDKIGGMTGLAAYTEELYKKGNCKTASLAIHGAGKATFIELQDPDWGGVDELYWDVKHSQAMTDIAHKIVATVVPPGDKYVAVQMRARRPLQTDNFNQSVALGYKLCYRRIVKLTKDIMKEHNIKVAFIAADILQRNTTGYHSPFHEPVFYREMLVNSGINWTYNVDVTYGKYWQYDRGAHAMIDQVIAAEADYFVYTGTGSYSHRIRRLRERNQKDVITVHCEPPKEGDVDDYELDMTEGGFEQLMEFIKEATKDIVIPPIESVSVGTRPETTIPFTTPTPTPTPPPTPTPTPTPPTPTPTPVAPSPTPETTPEKTPETTPLTIPNTIPVTNHVDISGKTEEQLFDRKLIGYNLILIGLLVLVAFIIPIRFRKRYYAIILPVFVVSQFFIFNIK